MIRTFGRGDCLRFMARECSYEYQHDTINIQISKLSKMVHVQPASVDPSGSTAPQMNYNFNNEQEHTPLQTHG